MNCSTPGLPVHHQLPEFTQTQVHRVGDALQVSHPLSSPSPPAPNPLQHQGLFQWVNRWSWRDPSLQVLRSIWSPRVCVCVCVWKYHSFLCIFTGGWLCLVGIGPDCLICFFPPQLYICFLFCKAWLCFLPIPWTLSCPDSTLSFSEAGKLCPYVLSGIWQILSIVS